MSDVVNWLIQLYMDIVEENPISKLGKPFTYYYADDVKTDIVATNLVEVDIKSAFPTICCILFGDNHPFVQNIFALDDKLQRNIYIATTLKQQSQVDGGTYLNDLNLLCKILILSFVYTKYQDISILEYVKDGILIRGTRRVDNNAKSYGQLLDFIKRHNIEYHEDPVKLYTRFNKTSIFMYDKKTKVKGRFHNPPEYILKFIELINNGNIYNKQLLYDVKKIYSDIHYEIIKTISVADIKYYYEFDDNKYINNIGMLSSLTDIYPKGYLTEFIYPFLSLLRMNKKVV